MPQGYFITGTDTNVGKTFFAVRLLNQLRAQGYTTAAIKPIASGCEQTAAGLQNQDALLLQQAATLDFPYHAVNPYAFFEPIAPHIGAQNNNQQLSIKQLIEVSAPILNSDADYIVVEGAGGWLVPLNETETMADFAKALNFSVILVIGIRLGCLNHTLLTWQSMQTSGIKIAGWVANKIDPNMKYIEDNISTLTQYLQIPPMQIIDRQYN